jgi:NTE family protein
VKPKIGIALGGGGAKGYAHIGVLEVLSENGFEIDIVSGTSAGAIVGAAFASETLSELKSKVLDLKLRTLPFLLPPSFRFKSLVNAEKVEKFISSFLPIQKIELLPKRFAAVAVDLRTQKIVYLNQGDLSLAVRASISLPAVFQPIEIDNYLLVDGGVGEPLPVHAARELGADFVIAVDLYGHIPTASKKSNLSIIDVGELTASSLISELTRLRMKEHAADFVLAPDLSDFRFFDFHCAEKGIALGRVCAEKMVGELKVKLAAMQQPL